MAFFKCKMCGGDLDFIEGVTVCECEYCGTKQTLPKTGNEQKINAMNRANHFRRQCEFDRAIESYEKILQDSGEDSELYWALALCRYGIEYVDDPHTGKKIPTCHRMQYTSILDDADYRNAIEKADEGQKTVYMEEAEKIAEIQRTILQISNKEKPFDVFICYKETAPDGSRTNDSVLAQDIYYGLTEKGYKVFFSKITLERKLGTAYEPYIFAALNSARVMIVVGTKPEYINSVWVKNEWSRFLMLMQSDRSKLIIPAYRDMDPYDLPDALSIYQSQDMSKLGFMQDLIRGVSKVLEGDKEEKASVEAAPASNEFRSNVEALLKRGKFALEDSEWERAFDFFDQVLNCDAESAEAYLGQALAKNHAANAEDYISKLLKRTENAEPEKHSKGISADEFTHVREMLKENEIMLSDVINSQKFSQKYEYSTYTEVRQKQLDNMLDYFEADKLLKKAMRFSKDGCADDIVKIKESVIPVLEERLIEAKKQDAAAEEDVDKKIAQMRDELIGLAENAINQKEKRYEDFVRKYNENLLGDMNNRQIRRTFELFGKGYKEVPDYVKKIDEILKEDEVRLQMLQTLQDEKREILKSFADLGRFSGRKRREKEMRLGEIDEEIEKLKAYINNG